MTYYAMNIAKKADGKIVFITKSGDRAAMEYQYHLMCANTAKNEEHDLYDACEWGTMEGGRLERMARDHEAEAEAVPVTPTEVVQE